MVKKDEKEKGQETMKIAFYKGMGVGGKWTHKMLHWGISRISSPHTHVELIFSDKLSFSSEFGIGPRFKNIYFNHPERWTIIDFDFITPEMESRMRRRAELLNALRENGMLSYDTRGAVGCVITGIDRAWKYFCSEVVYEVLSPEISVPRLNYKMHPQKLFEVIDVVLDLSKV